MLRFLILQAFAGEYPGYRVNVTPLSPEGVPQSFAAVTVSVINTFMLLAYPLIGVVFVGGALMLIASHGKDDQAKRGKDLMIGAVIGLSVMSGAYAIIQLVLSLVTE